MTGQGGGANPRRALTVAGTAGSAANGQTPPPDDPHARTGDRVACGMVLVCVALLACIAMTGMRLAGIIDWSWWLIWLPLGCVQVAIVALALRSLAKDRDDNPLEGENR